MHKIELQTVLNTTSPERPMVLLPYASERLVLQVADSGAVVLVVGSLAERKMWRQLERNPSGVHVVTAQRMTRRGEWPAPTVVLIGTAWISNFLTKFHKMLKRGSDVPGRRVICITSSLPEPKKAYSVASALRRERELFGPWQPFIAEHFVTQRWPRFTQICGSKEGAADRIAAKLGEMTETRFQEGRPDAQSD